MPALGWVDWTLLGLLGASVLVGLVRGLVFELMSLVGWLVAYVAAQAFAAPLAAALPRWLPEGFQLGPPGSALQQGAAFALAFVGVLIGWGLLARLVRLLVHATPLTALDRGLGAGFGLLRGGVLLLALATVVSLTPVVQSAPWQHSRGAAWLGVALQGLKPVLPQPLSRHLPD